MTQTTSLGAVDLYLSQYTAGTGSNLALSIFSNSGGLPGANLYNLSTNVAPAPSSTPVLVTYTGTGSFTLNAGTAYWLELYATNATSSTGASVQWDGALSPGFTNVNPTGSDATDDGQLRSVGNNGAFTGSPSTTELRTAFQLDTAAVSEPGSLMLVGIIATGGLVMAAIRRRRQQCAALA